MNHLPALNGTFGTEERARFGLRIAGCTHGVCRPVESEALGANDMRVQLKGGPMPLLKP